MTTSDKRILFACTQNSVRSVMAKSLFETNLIHLEGAVSCGVIEGPLDGFVVAVLQENGIDVSKHQSQAFEALDPANFKLIVSFPVKQKTKPVDGLMRDVKPYSGMSPRHIQMSGRATQL